MIAPLLICLLGLQVGTAQVTAVPAPNRVVLSDGRQFALYGLASVAPTQEQQEQARALAQGEWTLVPLDVWDAGEGESHRQDKAAWLVHDGKSLNLELVRAGLALVEPNGFDNEHLLELVAVAREAQRAGAGLWAERRRPPAAAPGAIEPRLGAPPPISGVALPLHEKQSFKSYAREMSEIRALGAQWVNLIVATRQDKVDSSSIPLGSDRTPPDWRIVEAIREARAAGLEVLLIPIVLIRNAKADEWRGVIKPTDPAAWWRGYQRYLLHMAELAAVGGASALSVGSEFTTLEKDPVPWRRLILAVRARFPGWLTYSANWDHFDKLPFWSELDFASMTAYFTLTKRENPSLDDVCEGWRKGLAEVRRLAQVSGLPAVISEVGVPSQSGALGSPWDYTRMKLVDLEAQRLGFQAFREVFTPQGRPAEGFHGAFLYDWWSEGGSEDMGYTARGKPAEILWRQILAGMSYKPRQAPASGG